MLLILATVAQVTVIPRATEPRKDYPIRAVPLTSVRITDRFWAPKREINRTVTIPHIMQQNELTGRVDNFLKAAKKKPGAYQGQRYNDTDVYKVDRGGVVVAGDASGSAARQEGRRADRDRRGRAGAGRLSLHAAHRSIRESRAGRGPGALVVAAHEPRALRPGPHDRGRRRALQRDGQAQLPRHRDQERGSDGEDVRSGRAPRRAGPRGDRARAGEALSRHRRAEVSRPREVLPRRARPEAQRRASASSSRAIASSCTTTSRTARTRRRSRSRRPPSATPSARRTCTRR